jgi:membrane-associated HD superfamily phosphohydrolase
LRCCGSTSGELPLSPSKNLCALLLLVLSTDQCQENSFAHQKNLIIIIIIITTSGSNALVIKCCFHYKQIPNSLKVPGDLLGVFSTLEHDHQLPVAASSSIISCLLAICGSFPFCWVWFFLRLERVLGM